MPIISKDTWDKFDPCEKKEIRELYSSLLNALKHEQIGSEEHLRLSTLQDRYISLFGKENLQPQPLTYEDVARELFGTGIDEKGHFATVKCLGMKWDNKLQAIGRLLTVAKFLNKDWKPDWKNDEEPKWYICNLPGKKPIPCFAVQCNSCIVYFRTQQLVHQAIQILGEQTVRLALTTEY